MFSSIYWYIFMLLINCLLFFKSESVFWKGLTLTGIILYIMIVFIKMLPEINIHIHKDNG